MNLLHLRYFYEVARTRSFTESSRNLRISQPAISKMVQALENELGHQLLERSRKGLKLTAEGTLVFEGAARIFAEERQLEERVGKLRSSLAGEWSLGVSDNIAVYLLPRPMGRFKEKHPGLRISVFAGNSRQIKDELQQERANLGIFYTPLRASEPFESRLVRETEFWIVIARRNRWRATERSTLADLRKLGVSRIESRHADYSGGFPAHFHSKRLGISEPPWLEVNQHEVIKRMVREGLGYALLTRHTVEEEIKSGDLIRVQAPRRLSAPIYAAWRKGRTLDRVSEAFLSHWGES